MPWIGAEVRREPMLIELIILVIVVAAVVFLITGGPKGDDRL